MSLKTVVHAIVIIGVLLSLLELLGFLKDKDRTCFYQNLRSKLEASLDAPGAKQFIKDFVESNANYRNVDLSQIEKITVRALGLGPADDERGNATEMMAGHVVLKRKDGKLSQNLCSIDELRSWAGESPFWRWFCWVILAIGVTLGAIIFVFEEFIKKSS